VAAMRRIQLKRYRMKEANHLFLRGFRIRVEVAEAIEVDEHVFIYSRHHDANTDTDTDTFESVASFPDMSWYPVNDPDPALGLPFFRKNFVELDVRSTSDYENIWTTLVQQVCQLVHALDRAGKLELFESVVCEGAEVVSDVSESTSA
jgi:hypothetical protein